MQLAISIERESMDAAVNTDIDTYLNNRDVNADTDIGINHL